MSNARNTATHLDIKNAITKRTVSFDSLPMQQSVDTGMRMNENSVSGVPEVAALRKTLAAGASSTKSASRNAFTASTMFRHGSKMSQRGLMRNALNDTANSLMYSSM